VVSTPRRLTASAVVIGALAAIAVLPSCSNSTPAGGTATVPTAPPTTTDPWAVPATITPDYINRVLAKLNQIDGDAKRDSRRTGQITTVFTANEAAIRADQHELELTTRDWQSSIDQHFAGIRAVPGDRAMKVLHFASTPCILAAVTVDFSLVTDGPPRPYPPWYVGLVSRAPDAINPTHWVLVYDGFETNGSSPDPGSACATS